jgi:hypothetical protein
MAGTGQNGTPGENRMQYFCDYPRKIAEREKGRFRGPSSNISYHLL